MTGIEPVLPPTQRYTIKETCGILGIHRNTLHRKTMEGEIKGVFRQSGKKVKTYYLGKDIMRFWRVTL